MVSVPTERALAASRTDGPRCDVDGLPDEELLDRFLGPDRTAAEDAFRALVRRHGPMVRGVCRRVLDQPHDAEDATQAAFLRLARKAGRIRDRRALGRWLCAVAYRIAVGTRTGSVRRRTYELHAAGVSAAAPGPEHHASWSELRLVLQEEVDRLPATYRSAVVLCYLEELTNVEAAGLLGWPVGTVKGRLARGRALLRARLTRRGLAL
jgi:RNA polymerase sigma factor (sigma-70 family)